MADSIAQSIVERALALSRTQPLLSPLEVLDLAMEGHHDTAPDFKAPAGSRFADWLDRRSPFGQLLSLVFRPSRDDPHAWEQSVLPAFAARYNLWGI